MRLRSRLGIGVALSTVSLVIASLPALAANGAFLAWEYFPGPVPLNSSGTATTHAGNGWLTDGATTLTGPNAHAYLDPADDDTPGAGDEVAPSSGSSWSYSISTFNSGDAFHNCDVNLPCTWDSTQANSWQVNQKAMATQAFYLVNKAHDHFAAAPFSFTAAKGSFEGADPVRVEVEDGAGKAAGFPDDVHLNAVRMTTPKDGSPPRLELGLISGLGDGGEVDSAASADLVFHAYAEGMADRLVTGAGGTPALAGLQGQALRSGWGDWFAMDYVVGAGYDVDNAEVGDVNYGFYVTGGDGLRSQPMDCPVSTITAPCVSTPAGNGGYTYADIGRLPGAVGAGEVWSQTIWDVRRSLIATYGVSAGTAKARTYLSRGLEGTPANPTMLDARDAILRAGKADLDLLWDVFGTRGLGFRATTTGPGDTKPHEDFSHAPPGVVLPLRVLVPAKVKVSKKGTYAIDVYGDPAESGKLTVFSKKLGKLGGAKFTTKADGTVAVKLKLSKKKLAKLVKAGTTKVTVVATMGSEETAAKTKLVPKKPRKN